MTTTIDIDALAEQVGMVKDGDHWFSLGSDDFDVRHEHLVAFAKLVAAAEREACAKVCKEIWKDKMFDANTAGIVGWISQDIEKAIRARGQS